jgi:hypothetical protein
MSEVNEGVGIILARMESHPEEFFGMHENSNNKWRWMFAESLREVMSEPEKAAIFEGMKKVRRLEITHKAIATIIPDEEEDDEYADEGVTKTLMANRHTQPSPFGAVPKTAAPKKQTMSRSEWEVFKAKHGASN